MQPTLPPPKALNNPNELCDSCYDVLLIELPEVELLNDAIHALQCTVQIAYELLRSVYSHSHADKCKDNAACANSVGKHLAEGVAPEALLTGTCFSLGLSGSATSSTRMSLMLLCVCM